LSPNIPSPLPPLIRVLRQTRRDNLVQPQRRHRLQRGHRHRLVLQDRRNQTRLALAAEGPLAGGHLNYHRPEGEDVGPVVRLFPLQLLRGHVSQCPEGWETVGIERAFDERVPTTRQPETVVIRL
jgi:hypothetical protein